LAVLLATIIERPVAELMKRHIPRGLSILAIYISIIGVIVLGSVLASPLISEEAANFREEAPARVRDLRNDWRQSDNGLLKGPGVNLLDRVLTEIDNPSQPPTEVTIGVVTGVGGGLLGALTVFVMAFYYLTEKTFIRKLILDEVRPESRERIARTWDQVETKVGQWLRGQLTLCLIIGTLSFIGYGAMGVRFWPLLALWAGITEIIPIVGPWIGGAPAVIIAMTQGWDKALMVTAFVVVLQMLENTVLVPRVMRGAVGLSPLTVFVAILAGTQMLNIVGALLAIPVAAAVQVVLSEYLDSRREANRQPEIALPTWRWMRGSGAVATSPPANSASTTTTPGSSGRQRPKLP
jgi:predicted PurR-regulated permease PerM